MFINQMIDEMEKTYKKINEIGLELKYKEPAKYELFKMRMKHSSEWAFHLTQRVITNYKKAEITSFYKQSQIALKRIERVRDLKGVA